MATRKGAVMHISQIPLRRCAEGAVTHLMLIPFMRNQCSKGSSWRCDVCRSPVQDEGRGDTHCADPRHCLPTECSKGSSWRGDAMFADPLSKKKDAATHIVRIPALPAY
eukprot:12402249-Karenia_brevis.AAC.1